LTGTHTVISALQGGPGFISPLCFWFASKTWSWTHSWHSWRQLKHKGQRDSSHLISW
jgi:hypothetical protein